ncbi:MAG: hypothetical protein NXI31_19825 [bacterium]|nr:hypothetical protein [bacterium]
METPGIIVLVLTGLLLIRLLAGALDGDRLRDYLANRDCELLAREWRPFAPGWFGSGHARLYAIEYRDAIGQRCRAIARTSAFSGVYLTEQEVVAPAERVASEERSIASGTAPGAIDPEAPSEELTRLRAENARLRAQLERES